MLKLIILCKLFFFSFVVRFFDGEKYGSGKWNFVLWRLFLPSVRFVVFWCLLNFRFATFCRQKVAQKGARWTIFGVKERKLLKWMLRIFEAIKKSPFFNVIFPLCPSSEKASAEIVASACLSTDYVPKWLTARLHKTGVTPEFWIQFSTALSIPTCCRPGRDSA